MVSAISLFDHRYHLALLLWRGSKCCNLHFLHESPKPLIFWTFLFFFKKIYVLYIFIFFFVDTERTQLTLTGSTGKGSVSIEKTTNTKEKRKWDKKILACNAMSQNPNSNDILSKKHAYELLVAKFFSLRIRSKEGK